MEKCLDSAGLAKWCSTTVDLVFVVFFLMLLMTCCVGVKVVLQYMLLLSLSAFPLQNGIPPLHLAGTTPLLAPGPASGPAATAPGPAVRRS